MNKPLISIGGPAISVKIGSRPATLIIPREELNEPAAPIVWKSKEAKRQRKIRSTSFNVADPLEHKLNAHADRFSCFSTYVKRLIYQDILSCNTTASTATLEDQYYDVMTSNVTVGPGGAR